MKLQVSLVFLLALTMATAAMFRIAEMRPKAQLVCPSTEGKYGYLIDFEDKAYRFHADGQRTRPDGKIEFFVGDQVVLVFPEDG